MTTDFQKSRILLLDPDDRVLLFLTKAPVSSNPTRWVTPGGHVEPGETHHEAAIRELYEETGLSLETVGEPIWSHEFTDERAPGVFKTNYEEWFTARTQPFVLSNTHWTPEEHDDMVASRWWSVDELEATDEALEPDELVELIHRVLGENRA